MPHTELQGAMFSEYCSLKSDDDKLDYIRKIERRVAKHRQDLLNLTELEDKRRQSYLIKVYKGMLYVMRLYSVKDDCSVSDCLKRYNELHIMNPYS